jgi:hypothetical protein
VSASAFVTVPAAAARDGSVEARRAARVEKFNRERLVIDYLNRGVSVREIAVKLGVTEKRMRAIVKEALAAHLPGPPEEFVALQISRLNEALLVAYSAMSGMNLKAVDRVVRIARELDRYHGFFPAERRAVCGSGRPAVTEVKAEEPLALLADGSGLAMQAVEMVQSAPGNGTAPNSSDEPSGLALEANCTQAEGQRSAAQGARDAHPPIRPEMAPQAIENAQSEPGNDTAPNSSDEPSGLALEASCAEAEGRRSTAQGARDAHPPLRPEKPPQAIENAQSAPGNNTAPSHSDEPSRLALEANCAEAEGRRPAAQGARDAHPPIRPEKAPQAPEKAQSAPGNNVAFDASGEPFLSPPGQDADAQDALAYEPLSTAPIEISPQNGVGAQSPRCASLLSPGLAQTRTGSTGRMSE